MQSPREIGHLVRICAYKLWGTATSPKNSNQTGFRFRKHVASAEPPHIARGYGIPQPLGFGNFTAKKIAWKLWSSLMQVVTTPWEFENQSHKNRKHSCILIQKPVMVWKTGFHNFLCRRQGKSQECYWETTKPRI